MEKDTVSGSFIAFAELLVYRIP